MRHDSIDPEQYTPRGWPRATVQVRDRMTAAVTVRADSSALSARDLMRAHRLGELLVLDHAQRPVGALSETDLRLCIQEPAEASRRDPSAELDRMTASQLMRRDLVTVGPNMDIADASDLMRDRAVGVLAVIEGGKLIGMLTARDVQPRPAPVIRWKF